MTSSLPMPLMRSNNIATPGRHENASRSHSKLDNEERRVSGSGPNRSRGSNAVESFRGYRRASLESNNDGDGTATPPPSSRMNEPSGDRTATSSAVQSLRASRRASVDSESAENANAYNGPSMECIQSGLDELAIKTDVLRAKRRNSHGIDGAENLADGLSSGYKAATKVAPAAYNVPAKADSGSVHMALPDRPDPIGTPANNKMTPARKMARSTRFSDANVNLDGVERLRTSLGRRRSIDVHAHILPETPKLRRTHFGNEEDVDYYANQTPDSDVPEGGLLERSPLRSIVSNGNKVSPPLTQQESASAAYTSSFRGRSRMSTRLAKLDDGDLGLGTEEVEDLGEW